MDEMIEIEDDVEIGSSEPEVIYESSDEEEPEVPENEPAAEEPGEVN